jgi:hypothetical protein
VGWKAQAHRAESAQLAVAQMAALVPPCLEDCPFPAAAIASQVAPLRSSQVAGLQRQQACVVGAAAVVVVVAVQHAVTGADEMAQEPGSE